MKTFSKFNLKNSSKQKKHRGITDIIGTMMLMAVTVTGAATLTYFVNDAFVSGNLAAASTHDSSKSIQLLAYDARDSSSLLGLTDLDNQLDGRLCGLSCTATNELPINGGSEFIIMKIKNTSFESVFLSDIKLNNIEHDWDFDTSGILLVASSSDLTSTDGRNYPADGKFSILQNTANPLQFENTEIPSGKTANLLVKLGPGDKDVSLGNGIRVFLNVGTITPIEFMLESGGVR
jgi:flagellin-like protein